MSDAKPSKRPSFPDVAHERFGIGTVVMCSEKGCVVDFLGTARVVAKAELREVGSSDVTDMMGDGVSVGMQGVSGGAK